MAEKDLDEVLAAVDHRQAVQDLFVEWGSTYQQAKVAADSLAAQFKSNGATLTFNGKSARTDDSVRAHFEKTYSFLVPQSEASHLQSAVVDRALQDRAFVQGSPDARAAIFKQLGRDQAKFDALAQSYGLRDAKDYRKGVGASPVTAANGDNKKTPNPWSAESWNVTEQGRVYRSNPTLAASLAASAGSRIGATKPPQRAA